MRIANLDVINAVLYVAENGCKWRALPERFGNWHTIYTRLGGGRGGVLDRLFKPCRNIARFAFAWSAWLGQHQREGSS